jgi:hypothetical protein
MRVACAPFFLVCVGMALSNDMSYFLPKTPAPRSWWSCSAPASGSGGRGAGSGSSKFRGSG